MESELRQKAAQVLRDRKELSPHFAEDPPTYEQLRSVLHESRLRETELDLHNGELLQTVVLFRSEIAELQRLESERLATALRDRDKQHVESLGLMAGGISHELNNIFCGIQNSIELARRVEVVQGQLSAIELGIQRATHLCEQLLAYSGRGRFVVLRHNINSLVEDSLAILQPRLTPNIALALHLDSNSPSVLIDGAQVQRAIIHLVENAAEAIGKKMGSITIRTGKLSGSPLGLIGGPDHCARPAGEYVYVEFEDTDGGISPEIRERIFEPFFTTKTAHHGLGLSSVIGIMRGHLGEVQLEPGHGCGSIFRLLFPAVLDSSQPTSAQTEARRGCLLVVDDDRAILETTALLLELEGFDVVKANSGLEALERFSADPAKCSLALMDIRMPGMDGDLAMLEMLKVRPAFPVVLMSGYSEHSSRANLRGKLAAGFLQKPFSGESLLNMMQKVLSAASATG